MKLIILPLLLIAFSSVLGVCRVLGYLSFSGNPVGTGYYNSSGNSYFQNGSLSQNGTGTQVSTDVASVGLSGVISAGVISLIVASIAVAVASGITVLGSGLNSVSVMAIFKSCVYYGVWALFSVFALVLFGEVPVFGYPLYFLLTLFYSLGVVSSVGFMG